MNGTKTIQAPGYCSITGRTMPMDQLSRVMIWNSEYMLSPTVPNQSGKALP